MRCLTVEVPRMRVGVRMGWVMMEVRPAGSGAAEVLQSWIGPKACLPLPL
jgi:hypothetical protein